LEDDPVSLSDVAQSLWQKLWRREWPTCVFLTVTSEEPSPAEDTENRSRDFLVGAPANLRTPQPLKHTLAHNSRYFPPTHLVQPHDWAKWHDKYEQALAQRLQSPQLKLDRDP
jgi:hypothetical protein